MVSMWYQNVLILLGYQSISRKIPISINVILNSRFLERELKRFLSTRFISGIYHVVFT